MTRRIVKGAGNELASKHDENKSVVAEEVGFREAEQNMIKAEFMFLESKSAQQIRSGLITKDEDPVGPWYFTHV